MEEGQYELLSGNLDWADAAGGHAPTKEAFILEVVNEPLDDLDQELLGAGAKPISFGVTEQFTTTLMVSAYAGLLLSLPVILYQLYAFVLPAFSPTERRVATPLLVLVPVLFITGVVFCYFVVLTPALEFLLNFMQALIFSVLTLMFTLIAIEGHHDEDHAEGHEGLAEDLPEGNIAPKAAGA